jgi:glutamate-ammonia-ligase adenylyltransferase
MHGHQHPTLRTTNTMDALAALVETGLVARDAGLRLRKAYLFFRTLIDGLRMVRGNAKDLVLPDPESDDFVFLARRVGYATEDWQAGASHLQSDLARHMANTRAFFERRFGAV